METRRATQDDIDAVVETLALAFHDDPTWSWAFPDPQRRHQQQATFWRFLVEEALRFDDPEVFVTSGCEVVAVWLPPGEAEVSEEREGEIEPMLEAMLGERATEVMRLLEGFEANHPHGPEHHYLSLLGVHDDHRGKGLGMGLLEENLARFDADGGPTYLESSNAANDFRYERRGYRRIGDFTTPDGAVTIANYWRDSQ